MARFWARLLTTFRRSAAEADLAREINAHLQLLEDDFIARGLSPAEARFAARRAFGGQVEQTKERQRDARSFRLIGEWGLDIRLGLRMLVRYPGLTIVSILGMAVAIAISVGAFSIVNVLLHPTLPLHEGDRIISVQNWNTSTNTAERRAQHDFAIWRDEVTALSDLGRFRQASRTLVGDGIQTEVVRIAEISASAFRVARVAPALGRYLVDADERAGAAPVIVIGHAAWRARFAADPNVVGRTIRLGATTRTIVGVMPAGFAFPIHHQYWVPLPDGAMAYEPSQGPEISIFGRLAPGATLASAQAQLTTIGQRLATTTPATHAALAPQVVPYTYPFTDMDDPENALALRIVQFMVALLLGIVCVNVAILVYARTATRHAEIAVRTALGAGRPRIVAQLFVEALVLASVAATAGVGIVALALREIDAALIQVTGPLPFWMDFSLSPGGIAYTLALAVLAAAIVGVVPALKVTGNCVRNGLPGISAGGGAGMRLGRLWTGLIVAQVALAVAMLPTALYYAWDAARHGVADPGFAAHEFLTAHLTAEEEARERFADRHVEVMRRLRAHSQLAGATSSLAAPGFEPRAWIEIDGVAPPPDADDYGRSTGSASGHPVALNHVDTDWFAVFEVPLLRGRLFSGADTTGTSTAAIVNRSFAEQLLRSTDPLGRRFRYVGASVDARPDDVVLGRWYDIVGVVPDFPVNDMGSGVPQPKVYHPIVSGALYPVSVSVRMRAGDAAAFTTAMMQTVANVDASLQLRNVHRLDDLLREEQSMLRVVAGVLVLLTLSVVVLSAAGIYSMMSCAVEQRRREIGIRAALGADPRRLLAAIFARALMQLAAGAAVGMTIAAALEAASAGDLMANQGAVLMPVVAVFMTLVGLVAAWAPARRGLRIHPSETLRGD